jgi:hypothetical protein
MTIIYPIEFKGNQKFDDESSVYYLDYGYALQSEYLPKHDGMTDHVLFLILHKEAESRLRYKSEYKNSIHTITSEVDCRYHSNNLEYLLNIFKKFEEIL